MKTGSKKNILFLSVLAAVFLSGIAHSTVYADKDYTWSTVIPQPLYYFWSRFFSVSVSNGYSHGIGWAQALAPNTAVSVIYRTKVTNYLTGQEVPDGATLPVGTELLFEKEAPQTGDVSWFGTGSTLDSPYGYMEGVDGAGNNPTWNAVFNTANSTYQSGGWGVSCDPQSYVGTFNVNSVISYLGGTDNENVVTTNSFPTYISLVVNDPGAVLSDQGISNWSWSDQNDAAYTGGIYGSIMQGGNVNIGYDGEVTTAGGIGSDPYLTCTGECVNGTPFPGWPGSCAEGTPDQIASGNGQRYSDAVLCRVNLLTSTSTVQTSHPITLSFDFATTSAAFYYRYYDSRTFSTLNQGPGCYGNNTPLAPLAENGDSGDAVGFDSYYGYSSREYGFSQWLNPDGTENTDPFEADYNGGLSEPPLNLTIPAQEIDYNFTIVASDTAPLAPTVTGPATLNGTQTMQGNYNVTAIDPDALTNCNGPCGKPTLGDRVRYGIDWNDDGIVDQWVPSYTEYNYTGGSGDQFYFTTDNGGSCLSGDGESNCLGYLAPTDYFYDYDTSGLIHQASHTWTSLGTSTFEVLAQDDQGLVSPWTQYSTNVTYPLPIITITYYDTWNGGDAQSTGTSTYSDVVGGAPKLQWSTQYASACQASGSYVSSNAGTWDILTLPTIAAVGQNVYNITCEGTGGTTTQSVTVNVLAGPPPTVSLAVDGTGDEGTATAYAGNDNYAYWNTKSATSCVASATKEGDDSWETDDWSGSVGTNGWNEQDLGTLPVGNYTYSITCTNAEGTSTDSVPLQVTVGPPTISCLTTANEQQTSSGTTYIPTGTNVTYEAEASGGTPPYTYSWDGYSYDHNWNYTDDGFEGDTDSTISTTYTTSGYHYADVTVTDAADQSSYAQCRDQYGQTPVIDTPPTVAPTVIGPTVGVINTNYTFTASSSEDNGDLSYGFIPNDNWYPGWYYTYWEEYEYPTDRQDPIPNQIDDANWSTPGTYDVGAIAIDPYGLESPEGFAAPTTITDGSVPPDTCSADVNPASTGQLVTWSVATSSSSPTFAWSGDVPSSALYQDSTTYSTAGPKSAQVTVTSNGVSHTVDCGSTTVNTGLPRIDLSGSTGSAYTYGSVILSKTAPLQVKLSVSNADLGCYARGDDIYDAHVAGLTFPVTSDTSGITSPLTKSETIAVTCSNENGSTTATLHVGLLSITEF